MGRTLTITCEHCGKTFESNRKKRFCSDYCMHRHRYEKLATEIKQYQKNYREQNKRPNEKEHKHCEQCGNSFIPDKKTQRFCSDGCRIEYWRNTRKKYNQCIVCGSPIPKFGYQKYCSVECYNKAYTKICEECGKEFISQFGEKYCSPECARNAQRDKTLYVCKQCGKTFHRRKKIEDKCEFCSRECAGKYKIEHRPMVQREFFFGFQLTCKQCGSNFFSSSKTASFCSDECKKQWKDEHAEPIPIYYLECQQCGKKFVSPLKSRKFCSEECQKKSSDKKHEIRRRTRKRINGDADYSISLERLYKRDHGICAICGSHVNMKSDPNSNEYGSIDHIIPLAKGGKHTWDNVQLTHRICNSIKSDNM